jgi:hypothetical protein
MKSKGRTIYYIQTHGKTGEKIFRYVLKASFSFAATLLRYDARPTDGLVSNTTKETIMSASLVIADITEMSPRVIFEIGMARALNKPIVLLASSSVDVPFELSAYRILLYGDGYRDEDFRIQLFDAIKQAIESPSTSTPDSIDERKEKSGHLFISYSHNDLPYLERLLVHLKPLERDGRLILWVDTLLRAGDKWEEEIEKALGRSNAAILLISADFLASDFISQNELPPLLIKAQEMGTRIIPLILKPCRFARDKSLKPFQAINDPARPLVLVEEGEQEAVYDKVAAEIEKLFNSKVGS